MVTNVFFHLLEYTLIICVFLQILYFMFSYRVA